MSLTTELYTGTKGRTDCDRVNHHRHWRPRVDYIHQEEVSKSLNSTELLYNRLTERIKI